MRTEQEMMDLILLFAEKDERIKVVGMEGSRTNVHVPKDEFQDYDVTYVVTDMESFINDDGWLEYFGKRIFMQKPEAMSLFPPELGNWFSYLMLFEDGTRVDLKLVPISELDLYLSWDKLLAVLLDKDKKIKNYPTTTDMDYHVKKPTMQEYDDCCNEFWWVSTYVVKGLCRKEILYAIDHLNQIVRHELLRMISWKVGIETGFSLSVGKNFKYINKYIDEDLWNRLLSTYRMYSYENVWEALLICHELFREVSKEVSEILGFIYPEYDKNITRYTEDMYEKYESIGSCQ
ncbi:MAG TPA: aminoglycoside 6-adenylyltransferase [Clostridium sp.]|nr:aminoglycoside 6-adenylyltransferase [Clostridium sp.]